MRLPPHIVAIQLVSFIPVGTPMRLIVACHEMRQRRSPRLGRLVNRW